ncbi:alpha/beta hydrolase fold domain-containing protein [Pseudomonas sp.]|uniref:alpha/beta hydrolase fold domain-containing protein n=1 Tax=Pseudomonas sp. TaxID=306 RepID=UPI003D0A4687
MNDEPVEDPHRRRVSPELLPFLDAFPVLVLDQPSDLRAARAFADDIVAMRQGVPLPDGVERLEVTVPGLPGAPPVRTLVYRRTGVIGQPILLYVHGGGMIIGGADLDDGRNALLCASTGWTILAPDYRNAPEARWPSAVEDCYAVLEWLDTPDAASMGIGCEHVVVSGESGGGGIAAGLALYARKRSNPRIAALGLSAPMLDDRTGEPGTTSELYGPYMWTAAMNQIAWSMVLGEGADTTHLPVPARENNLAGLPPTFIYVGQLDLFFHEALDWTRRLSDAAVPVELHVFPGAFHGFDQSPLGVAPADARSLMDKFFRRHLELAA